MKRGEIWWANMPVPAGRRPVVLVSREAAYAPVRTRVIVVEVSRTIRSIATEVVLGRRDGLPQRCVANADNVATIPKTWLDVRIGSLAPDRVAALDQALRFALQL
jgi:mRNA interferase MazF